MGNSRWLWFRFIRAPPLREGGKPDSVPAKAGNQTNRFPFVWEWKLIPFSEKGLCFYNRQNYGNRRLSYKTPRQNGSKRIPGSILYVRHQCHSHLLLIGMEWPQATRRSGRHPCPPAPAVSPDFPVSGCWRGFDDGAQSLTRINSICFPLMRSGTRSVLS